MRNPLWTRHMLWPIGVLVAGIVVISRNPPIGAAMIASGYITTLIAWSINGLTYKHPPQK